MGRIRLVPGSSPLAIESNFQRIENATEGSYDVDRGNGVAFIGSVIITTRLSRVDSVVGSLQLTPVAGACFCMAYPYSLLSGPPNQIVLECYSNTFVRSVISQTMGWIASGEFVLG